MIQEISNAPEFRVVRAIQLMSNSQNEIGHDLVDNM
jgi:hypothetical protein